MLGVFVAILAVTLVGGMVGIAQEAVGDANGGTCPDASPGASPTASPDATPEISAAASPEASPTPCPTGMPDAGAAPTVVTVESVDIDFIPAEVTIPANTDVTFILPNNGRIPHNFSIDELDVSVTFQAGETKEVVINAPAGTYEYYCNIPGHTPAGMVGTLTVE